MAREKYTSVGVIRQATSGPNSFFQGYSVKKNMHVNAAKD